MPAYLINGAAIIAPNKQAAIVYHMGRMRPEIVAETLSTDDLGRHCMAGGKVYDVDAPEVTQIDLDKRQCIRDAELQAIGYMVTSPDEMSVIREMTDLQFAEFRHSKLLEGTAS